MGKEPWWNRDHDLLLHIDPKTGRQMIVKDEDELERLKEEDRIAKEIADDIFDKDVNNKCNIERVLDISYDKEGNPKSKPIDIDIRTGEIVDRDEGFELDDK